MPEITKKLTVTFFLIAIALALTAFRPARHLSAAGDDEVMRRQTRSFVRSSGATRQQVQARAIALALMGDSGRLDEVRGSRNAAPEMPPGVSSRHLTSTLRLYESVQAQGQTLPLLIYLHGGGWTIGSLNSCARYCAAMAATGRVRVLAVDYRLAPEHPYPAGLDDSVEAVRYAVDNAADLGADPAAIAVGGDSSGGNLAIAAAMRPEIAGQLAALVVFYPVTKAFSDGSASWRAYGSGYALDSELMGQFNMAYTYRSGHTPADPYISVGLAPDSLLKTLPPTLMVAAGRDILRDQGLELAGRLPATVTRVELPEAAHLFITVPGQDEAFRTAVILTTDFIAGLGVGQPTVNAPSLVE